MQQEIMREFAAAGLKVCAIPACHLPELLEEIDRLHEGGLLAEQLYTDMKNRFEMNKAAQHEWKTILTVALPAPIGRAVFNSAGRRLAAQIPPTYMDYGRVPETIERKLNGILKAYGYHAARSRNLPEKLLAVRSGLGEYGRNNICYVEGLGSFTFLSAYFTNMPCVQDGWRPARRMDLCAHCTLCLKNCPTGAITADRHVIQADRCLTMHNEADSSVPFPQWVDPTAHNSLVGCMHCQTVCPKNREFLDFTAEPVEFDEAETALMLAGMPPDELPPAMADKVKTLNMLLYYEPLARNLKSLFDLQT